MTEVEFVQQLESRGVVLIAREGRLVVDAPAGAVDESDP
jgi:hypothetical protein